MVKFYYTKTRKGIETWYGVWYPSSWRLGPYLWPMYVLVGSNFEETLNPKPIHEFLFYPSGFL